MEQLTNNIETAQPIKTYIAGIELYKSILTIDNKTRDYIEVHSWDYEQNIKLTNAIKDALLTLINIKMETTKTTDLIRSGAVEYFKTEEPPVTRLNDFLAGAECLLSNCIRIDTVRDFISTYGLTEQWNNYFKKIAG